MEYTNEIVKASRKRNRPVLALALIGGLLVLAGCGEETLPADTNSDEQSVTVFGGGA